MRHMPRPSRSSAFGLAIALAAALIAPSALAQSTQPPGQGSPPRKEQKEAKPEGQKPNAPKPDAGKPDTKADQEAAEAADPKKPQRSALPQTAAEKAKLLGDLYAQLATADDEEAAKKFSGMIERLWAHSGSDTVNLLLERAGGAMREKRAGLAEKLFDFAVSLAPDYPEAFNQRAYFHYSQNNFDGAVGDLRRVIALDPNHYKALEGLAQIFRDTGNKKAAFGVMKQLIEVHPFASGAKNAFDELKREVEGQGI